MASSQISSHAPQARSLYRRLLRELPSAQSNIVCQKLSAPSHIQRQIRNSLSEPLAAQRQQHSQTQSQTYSQTKSQTLSRLALAEQFVQYLQAQRMHATLLQRYNLGKEMSDQTRVRLSARRVGMNLPVEYQEKKEEEEEEEGEEKAGQGQGIT